MKKNRKIEEYIAKQDYWQKELKKLLAVIRKSKLEEEIKWGMPTFCYEGKMIFGMSAFKKYFGIWYFNGVFLKDEAKVLVNAQSGKTIGMRQWRFSSMDDINAKLIHQYNQEAIKNQQEGKIFKAPRKKTVPLPIELKEYLAVDKKAAAAFKKFTPGKQNEFKEYIGEAKREVTRLSRLEKCIPMILSGVSPMDKYRK